MVNFHLSCSNYTTEEQRTDSWLKGLKKAKWEEYNVYSFYWYNQSGKGDSVFMYLLHELNVIVYYPVINIQNSWVKMARRICHLSHRCHNICMLCWKFKSCKQEQDRTQPSLALLTVFSKRVGETSWNALICAMHIRGIFTTLWDLSGSIDFMAFKIKSRQKAHY